MKNFSTVGVRVAVVALFAGLLAAPTQAATCEFRPNAPDQHLVVKGDTLWDISGKFLEHPWCWPQVWGLNKEEIRNPHWIYPGQVIYFDRKNNRLSLTRPGSGDGSGSANGVLRLSPQVRTEGLGKDAIQAIPSGVIEPFLSQPLIVDADELKGSPRIAAAQEGHVYLGKDDKIYVRGNLKGGSSFQVFRPGTPLKDPETGKLVAYEAVYLGTAKLFAEAKPGVDAHTFVVATSKQEIGVGDLLIPAPPTVMRNYMPHPPDQKVDARIMGVYSGVTHAGQNQVVSINRGTLDGVDVGTVLQLYNIGKVVADPGAPKRGILGTKKTMIKLPDEQSGTLFIFRTFKRVSYGLIMQVTEPVEIGDVARSPE
ncbi:LysM peptidoglycan-binding domain-containing protein [Massilia sp. CCM 8695]|uniref:LysM peptidoglycan-binding domain-containing protein n=1 Tax=Massilia frigida TaxID=2609281 RepID=A0ABX0NCH5_9BURK|nr:LysM peptidoglycan-binding domain-containing protein [Massilia frigida]NHZ82018.1 LysM peptidoglycan-binding domain-containing protein [Massilia frigida]